MTNERGVMENETVTEEIEDNKMISLAALKGEYNKNRWRAEANCRGKGNESFFVERRGGASVYFEARCICFTCPVRQECLDFAIENSIKDGMWGGMTYRERLKYARGQRGPGISIFDLVKGLRGPNQTIRVLAERLGVSEEVVRQQVRKGRKP